MVSSSQHVEEFARFRAAQDLSGLATDESYLVWDQSEIVTTGTATGQASEPAPQLTRHGVRIWHKPQGSYRLQTDVTSSGAEIVLLTASDLDYYSPGQAADIGIIAADVSSFMKMTLKAAESLSYRPVTGVALGPTQFDRAQLGLFVRSQH
jgi:hypothetical protein